jgi:hypothetical protein
MSRRSVVVVARLAAAVARVQVLTAAQLALQRPALSGWAQPSAQVQEAAEAPPSVEVPLETVALVGSQPIQPFRIHLSSQLERLAGAVLELVARRLLARSARLLLAGSAAVEDQVVERRRHLRL